ncbi:YjiH family protein [Vibrio sp. SS-MA-C1-2]|uniref:nucleoside recognition domain-containing protein n=1 Tax=Vibrio sp. SS-MA-C1-2 TaxID=2908646 RepID=UPI001F2F6722|nr:nucleoside recognition domain-containing protein [Vibrio sp. SS-MA-C1-2]UJF16923.1 YjiH family protein [Vibrio sp. SS-MA-C1-2]
MSNSNSNARKVTIGCYIALAFAAIFFSGLLKSGNWYGAFDFTTLNGSFGKVVYQVQDAAEGVQTAATSFRGKGGSGAKDGFIFALTLVPTVMFALAMVEVLEHYGALAAARKLMTPLLRPLLSVPGSTGLALIASLQSTDAGASMTRGLLDEGHITQKECDVFTMFQFSAGATIVNFFSSGAVLFTLTAMDGSTAVPASIGLCLVVMLVMKVVGANLFRIYLNFEEKRSSKKTANKELNEETA